MADYAGANPPYGEPTGSTGRAGSLEPADQMSARQIPADMIGRLLDDGDLRRPQRMPPTMKPPAAPSVRRRTAARRWASDDPRTPQTARPRPHRGTGTVRLGARWLWKEATSCAMCAKLVLVETAPAIHSVLAAPAGIRTRTSSLVTASVRR